MRVQLGELAEPTALHAPLDILGSSGDLLKECLRKMLLIRRTEEEIGDRVATGEIVGPAHLAIGQEAVAVGVSQHLRSSDRVFGCHRSHSHYLALGGDVYALLAELLGKEDGCSRGMGGSMHLYAASEGLLGTVPIVSGTISLAVGAALAAKKDGKGDVAVAWFGDGATEEGAFHESLNLAAAWELPVLFVCENNLFSSHMHIELRQPTNKVARFAEANCLSTATVDGNDVVKVASIAEEMINHARDGNGPAFLEAITYRWRGHVGHREDQDVGVDRDGTLDEWKKRDPIQRLADALIEAGELTPSALEHLDAGISEEIAQGWKKAIAAAFPADEALLDSVYKEGSK
jgi:pyruvate dehydrogenase E1 component alpha subunit